MHYRWRTLILLVLLHGVISSAYAYEKQQDGIRLWITEYSYRPYAILLGLERYTKPLLAGTFLQLGYVPLRVRIHNETHQPIIVAPKDVQLPLIGCDNIAHAFTYSYIWGPLIKGLGSCLAIIHALEMVGIDTFDKKKNQLFAKLKEMTASGYHVEEKQTNLATTRAKLDIPRAVKDKISDIKHDFKNVFIPEDQRKAKEDRRKLEQEKQHAKEEFQQAQWHADFIAFLLLTTAQAALFAIPIVAYHVWAIHKDNQAIIDTFRSAMLCAPCRIASGSDHEFLLFVAKGTPIHEFCLSLKNNKNEIVTTFDVIL
jgi:hypothetical protein